MNVVSRILTRLGFAMAATDARAYVAGPALVETSESTWGHDDSQFSPAEYLDYIATSNNVYTCVTKRANAMSALPLQLYRGRKKDARKEVEKGDLRDLLDSVNPWMTFDRLINLTEQYLCLAGEAFWFLERGASGRGQPREIWPVRPDLVRVVPDSREFIRGFLLFPENGAEPIPYTPDEVIWFAYPNPKDPYAGLAPLAAARLAADTAAAAMRSNYSIFSNGTRIGGVLSPPDNGTITDDQARELQQLFSKGFKGTDKAHKLAVLAYAVKFQQWSMTPKDAEFLGALDLTLEEIARAFGIAPDLLGGSKRTYQNAPEARYAFWADTIMSEARFIQSVITERLLPMFPGEADAAEFDFSDVDALRENEDAKWKREKEQLDARAITVNEWRADQGLDAVPWGNVPWISNTLIPIDEAARPFTEPEPVPPGNEPDGLPAGEAERGIRAVSAGRTRAMAYGSDEHRQHMRAVERKAEPHDKAIGQATASVMRRQRQAVKARLKQRSALSSRDAAEVAENPFDLPRWIKVFRTELRPVIEEAVEDLGQQALDDLGLSISFDVERPEVINAIERLVQRFAEEVNQTTWDRLKASLAEGTAAGESVDTLAERVETVMADRIRSSGETIARTETNRASTRGDLEAWRQSGVVRGKRWLSALDARTRETHVTAHNQVVGLDEDFTVGEAKGPGPGNMGSAKEDVNCRCSMTAVLDIEWEEE